MKYFLSILFSLFVLKGIAQTDTLEIGLREFMDSVYADFSKETCPTNRLFNRIIAPKENTISWVAKFRKKILDSVTCDHLYTMMVEANYMAFDSSNIVNVQKLGVDAIHHMTEFDKGGLNQIPLGIFDYKYNWYDKEQALGNGSVSFDGFAFHIEDAEKLDINEERISYVAPLFDFISDDEIEFILLEKYIISEDTTPVLSVEINQGNGWEKYGLNDAFTFYCSNDTLQHFEIRIQFQSGYEIHNVIRLRTPKRSQNLEKKFTIACDRSDKIIHGANWLEWCLLEGCNNNRVDKPFILLMGYRPPVFGQSFTDSYELYNTNHNGYIEDLRNNGYDVFIVRFNHHKQPKTHSTVQSAQLLKDFIVMLNDLKNTESSGHYENIIQGNSMGVDIGRIALLEMEIAHKLNNAASPYHHSRLFISNDANFHGANIPISFQYLVKSRVAHISAPAIVGALTNLGIVDPTNFGFVLGGSIGLRIYLNEILDAILFKELVHYHADHNSGPFPWSPFVSRDIVPGPHPYRVFLNNHINNLNYQNKISPLPGDTRNIATSLGRIRGLNNTPPEAINSNNSNIYQDFVSGGNSFVNVDLIFDAVTTRSSWSTNFYYENFYRRSAFMYYGISWFIISMRQRFFHKNAIEYDVASGSYLKGIGNLGAVFATSGLISGVFAGNPMDVIIYSSMFGTKYSHKSVLSALAINRNLSPSDGSFTMDMHALGLMYQNYVIPGAIQSNHYGYPHLSNPTNHFDVTPFEAIYVDHEIDPHINLEDALFAYKDSLNSFLLNEVEPWYLGLQNLEVGSAVQSTITYKAKRRAKYEIICGELVTPITDPGEYLVLQNAEVVLNAGDAIILKPGVTISNGASFHAKIQYQICGSQIQVQNDGGNGNAVSNSQLNYASLFEDQENENETNNAQKVKLYPNPSKSIFTLSSDEGIISFEIITLLGKVVEQRKIGNMRVVKHSHQLPKGNYLVKVYLESGVNICKLVVL